MANQPSETPPQLLNVQWLTSPQYRIIHSNMFRHRINMGEMMLHFHTITDTGIAPAPVVIEEVSVAMSFPQIKTLRETLNVVIEVFEKEIGPIVDPNVTEEAKETFRQQVLTTVRTIYARTTS